MGRVRARAEPWVDRPPEFQHPAKWRTRASIVGSASWAQKLAHIRYGGRRASGLAFAINQLKLSPNSSQDDTVASNGVALGSAEKPLRLPQNAVKPNSATLLLRLRGPADALV